MGDAPVAPMLARLTRALPRDGYWMTAGCGIRRG
jgi:hypothetical protein